MSDYSCFDDFEDECSLEDVKDEISYLRTDIDSVKGYIYQNCVNTAYCSGKLANIQLALWIIVIIFTLKLFF